MTNSIVINKIPNSHWGEKTDMKALEKLMSENTRSLTNEEIDVMLGKKTYRGHNRDTTDDARDSRQENSD